MYENIAITNNNFCVGPQSGSFCFIDLSATAAVMRVKNSSGDLLNTYDFYPAETLPVNSNFSSLPYNKISTIKYVGPVNQTGFYSGMLFFTMERKHVSKYDTTIRQWVDSVSGFILRKWLLNTAENRLDLYSTSISDSDSINNLDCYSFAVKHIKTNLSDHVLINSGEVTLPTTSGIEIGDTVILGPSTNLVNSHKIEHCTVFSIDSPTVISIRTPGAYRPPLYEYNSGNPVTIVQDIYTIGSSNGTGISAAMYQLEAQNYYKVKDKHESNIYNNVIAMDWNDTYGTPSFIKGTQMLSVELSDYEISSSHTLKNITSSKDILNIYAISILGETIYRLQSEIQLWSDLGGFAVTNWSNYNYVADTMIPYVASINITSISDKAIITRLAKVIISIKVRDQYGVSVRDKNITFNKNGDPAAIFDPPSGQLLTDINGEASIDYFAGATYNGKVDIDVRSDGSSTHLGSQYVWVSTDLTSEVSFSSEGSFKQTELVDGNMLFIQYYFYMKNLIPPPGQQKPTLFKQIESVEAENIFEQLFLPFLNELISGYPTPCEVRVNTSAVYLNETTIHTNPVSWFDNGINPKLIPENVFSQPERGSDTGIVDQVYTSRHYSSAHIDTTTLNQFVFITEARPPFLSKKNSIDTDIWLRLRPFATDLDPNTLIIKIREISYAGDIGWVDITSEGTITPYDAGSGLNGLEFIWYDESYFHHNAIVYVTIEVKDTANPPNKILTDYWFKVIPDFKAPYINNEFPSIEEFNVPVDTEIYFDIHDNGSGVDINTIEILLDYTRVYPTTITMITENHYRIGIVLQEDFNYSDTISIEVMVSDVSDSVNTLRDSWRFHTAESITPWIDADNFYPGRCIEGIPRKHNEIHFQVYGTGNGVDVDSIELYVDGPKSNIIVTPIVYRLS